MLWKRNRKNLSPFTLLKEKNLSFTGYTSARIRVWNVDTEIFEAKLKCVPSWYKSVNRILGSGHNCPKLTYQHRRVCLPSALATFLHFGADLSCPSPSLSPRQKRHGEILNSKAGNVILWSCLISILDLIDQFRQLGDRSLHWPSPSLHKVPTCSNTEIVSVPKTLRLLNSVVTTC